ncbi:MAG TPA: DUF5916 domain-containing protein [Longimicrobiales bacterium]|nr:DUF5916 domain-containing protein [Longimicrobiales bacterium]
MKSHDRLSAVLLLVALPLGAAPAALSAQERPVASVGVVQGAIRVDGRLDEDAWKTAPIVGAMVMVDPVEGAEPTRRTEVRVLANATDLYFGILAFDPEPSGIVSYSKARDSQLRAEDYVKLVLDPYLDGRSGYIFAVNPGGARYDALVANRGEGENADWDAVWEAATHRGPDGWSVEIRLPLQSLTFDAALDRWGFNVERRVERVQEVSRWASPFRDAKIAQTVRAGVLRGLPRFETGLGLTVRPSATAGAVAGVRGTSWDRKRETSLDVVQRVGSNVTAMATVNTDFAETEVDTRRTNLTRFPLFFPEKRAFFQEGSDIFDFGLGLSGSQGSDVVPFFTRRMGLYAGEEVPVRVGAKTVGRAGRNSFGALAVRSGEVEGLVPGATMGAVRIRRDVLGESNAGLLATFGDPSGREGSYLVGSDVTLQTSKFRGSKNLLAGVWGLVAGSQDGGTDRTAWGAKIDYPNDDWDVAVTYKRIGREFQPAMGFVPRRAIHSVSAGINHRSRPSWPWMRYMYYELQPQVVMDLGGAWESYRIFTAPVNWRFESGDRFEFNVVPVGERLAGPFEVADGVTIPGGVYHWVRYRLEGDVAAKRKLSGRVSWWFGPFYDGDVSELGVSLSFKPSDLLAVDLSATRNDGSLPAGDFVQQVVGVRVGLNVSPDLQISSFGQYQRETGQFGANTRLRWTFSPSGDLFVVYNYNARDDDVRWTRESSQFLVKAQYALQR